MYEFNITMKCSFDEARAKVQEVLMGEQLGIVSEVDVQSVFKQKIDKNIPAYRIIGACNPRLADRVLASEPNAGTLLPCNLIMRESDDGVVVSFMDPVAVLGLSNSVEVKAVAEEARAKLQRVAAALQSA